MGDGGKGIIISVSLDKDAPRKDSHTSVTSRSTVRSGVTGRARTAMSTVTASHAMRAMMRTTMLHTGKLPRRHIIHARARVVSSSATDVVNISVLMRCASRGRYNETP